MMLQFPLSEAWTHSNSSIERRLLIRTKTFGMLMHDAHDLPSFLHIGEISVDRDLLLIIGVAKSHIIKLKKRTREKINLSRAERHGEISLAHIVCHPRMWSLKGYLKPLLAILPEIVVFITNLVNTWTTHQKKKMSYRISRIPVICRDWISSLTQQKFISLFQTVFQILQKDSCTI